ALGADGWAVRVFFLAYINVPPVWLCPTYHV
ncbi:MAG: hypothetical protein ACI845_000471, partial [Gammaproteobacteria bacterium]